VQSCCLCWRWQWQPEQKRLSGKVTAVLEDHFCSQLWSWQKFKVEAGDEAGSSATKFGQSAWPPQCWEEQLALGLPSWGALPAAAPSESACWHPEQGIPFQNTLASKKIPTHGMGLKGKSWVSELGGHFANTLFRSGLFSAWSCVFFKYVRFLQLGACLPFSASEERSAVFSR